MAICYLDKTFCSASVTRCGNEHCYRFLSIAAARRAESLDLPIAYADMSRSCKYIVPVDNSKNDTSKG